MNRTRHLKPLTVEFANSVVTDLQENRTLAWRH
jgi:hypothetical protein